MSEAYALQRGEGATYAFGPNFIVKAGETGTNGATFIDMLTKHGEEPGDHVHQMEDEMFYVVEGDVRFRCGEETFELTTGGFIFLPRGMQHGFTILNEGDARLLVVTTPPKENTEGWGGLIGYLEREHPL